MATDNKAVTCYLPEEIEQYLTKYCTEYSINRKDKNGEVKPSLGTGIVEILKQFFQGEDTLPSNALSFEQLKPLIEEAVKSNLPSLVSSSLPNADRIEEMIDSKLPNNLLSAEDLTIAIASLEEKFSKKITSLTDKNSRLTEELESVRQQLENISSAVAEDGASNEEDVQISQLDKTTLEPIFEAVDDEITSTTRGDYAPRTDKANREVGLSDRELASLLGVNETTAYRWRTKGSKPRDKKLQGRLEEWEVKGERWYRKS